MSMLQTFLKAYTGTKLVQDAGKVLAASGLVHALDDFDRDRWLHKAGLALYRPGARAAGGLSLFVLGAVAGGVAALLWAPKTGSELRTQVRERALDLKDRAKDLVQRNSAELSDRVSKMSDRSVDVRI